MDCFKIKTTETILQGFEGKQLYSSDAQLKSNVSHSGIVPAGDDYAEVITNPNAASDNTTARAITNLKALFRKPEIHQDNTDAIRPSDSFKSVIYNLVIEALHAVGENRVPNEKGELVYRLGDRGGESGVSQNVSEGDAKSGDVGDTFNDSAT